MMRTQTRSRALTHCDRSRYISAGCTGALIVAAFFVFSIPVHAATIQVVIKDMVFTPAQISVQVGDTVEWTNQDVLKHTATVDGDWDVIIPAKKSASLIVKKAGDYQYYCRFHPNMRGTMSAK